MMLRGRRLASILFGLCGKSAAAFSQRNPQDVKVTSHYSAQHHFTQRKCSSRQRCVGPLSTAQSASSAHDDVTTDLVPSMLSDLQGSPEQIDAPKISSYIEKLESIGKKQVSAENDSNPKRFDPLLGLYDVSFVKTVKEGDNPVGGKWTRKNGIAQKILKTRRSFQHILRVNETGCGATHVRLASGYDAEVVAEAVNVISLDALWGRLRATVILRGDAIALNATDRVTNTCQPLSSLAVRALFDAPRIVLGKSGRWFNILVGPKTSVVLDTTFVDDQVRIGLGGRSGSRFIFRRCNSDELEANEFRALLSRRPWSRKKTLSTLLVVAQASTYAAVTRKSVRLLGSCFTVLTLLVATLIVFSGGGIEADDRSVAEAKKIMQ